MIPLSLSLPRQSVWVQTVMKIFAGALVLTLASQITIFLPFTPVPIALAPSIALALGIVLGPHAAGVAVGIYLLEGACGLPVFSGARSGLVTLIGPTGGYLLGYVFGAFATGWVMQRCKPTRLGVLLAFAVGAIPLYLCGIVVLAPYVGWSRVLVAGVLPFLPGCALKIVALTSILPRRLIGSRG